ncbi:MAG: glycoside hydrolase family 3 C-terminal domain-containing protein [Deltaproteobacteria bacterium]|nr:glycoside hydrolase family 3 C-terminal domain-containing protein [Deltaproteobacteria bacterium]
MKLRRLYCVPFALVLGCSSSGTVGSDLERQVEELVAQMTLDEKVAQMSGDTVISGPYGDELWSVPGVERLGVPPLKMSDGPRGIGVLEGATAFPVAMARGASWNAEVERQVGEAMGRELRAIGGNVLLAPTINNLRHPSWGRSQETYGEDVHLLSRMGVAFVQGAQQYVLANPKHYAANSIEDTRFNVNVTVDPRTLREIYLPQFRAAVHEGRAASVMSAYNSVNGQFCGENEALLRGVLKGEWQFDGFVLSDFTFGTKPDSARNGLDLEMPVEFVFRDLDEQVSSGTLPEAVIDDAVRRMVRKKLEYELEAPSPVDESVIASAAHLEIAQQAAIEGSVLLKNASGALPLDAASLVRIAVVGSLADTANIGDTGSSSVQPAFVVTPLQGIEEAVGDSLLIDHIAKDVLDGDDLAAIEAADAVIVVTGLTAEDEGEGLIGAGDRLDLDLSPERESLIRDAAAANPRTIVVLEGGGAITMGDWLSEVEALLMVWYPGQMGGHAVADLLFGAANPSGKLPITFPTGLDQLPPFDNVTLEVVYDYFHGYRYLDRNGATPEFPFGFGLSYTTFSIENLQASQTAAVAGDVVRFSVDVTNTGSAAGAQVVQLYVTYPGSAVERSERELKGFVKVTLGAGESQTVEIALPVNQLAYYDVASSAWALEALEHAIHVGTSSRDLPLSTSLAVAAQAPVSLY